MAPLAPAGPAATPVCVKQEPVETRALNLETLESAPHCTVSKKTKNTVGRDFGNILFIGKRPCTRSKYVNISLRSTYL